MARYYDEPIQMECAGDGTPLRFVWRQRTYQVLAVLARWHLRDRWWATGASPAPMASATTEGATAREPATRHPPATDRYYMRLHCASPSTPMVFCIVYYDAALEAQPWPWRLERVYD